MTSVVDRVPEVVDGVAEGAAGRGAGRGAGEAPARRADHIPAPKAARPTKHRLNGLDGFRALAVTVVVLYHFGVPGFPGGWIGPELFFVLSGYLITTLLLDRTDADRRRLSLGDFWMRRAKRLYPALLFLVATVISLVALLDALHNSSVATVSPTSLVSEATAALAYYSNWHLMSAHVGYFGASTSLFKHTWSLAIEEQFYLLWPLVFVAIRRTRRWRAVGLAVAVGGAAASSLAAALSVSRASLDTVYYSTQTNAFHLLIGVALAFAAHGWTPGPPAIRRLRLAPLPAAAVIGLFVEVASGSSGAPRMWMLKGGEVALDLAAATLIAALVYGNPRSWLSRALNLRPVVWVGAISYGIYLWHYPLAVLVTPADTGLPRAILVLVLLAVTLAAAALSHAWVEVIVRETLIGSPRIRRSLYAIGVAGAALLLAGAPWLIRPGG
jgi:peptidoglycan/LPS O-acetylase OafA/YrhL